MLLFLLIAATLAHDDHVIIPHYAVMDGKNGEQYFVLDRCIQLSEGLYNKITKKDETTVVKWKSTTGCIAFVKEKEVTVKRFSRGEEFYDNRYDILRYTYNMNAEATVDNLVIVQGYNFCDCKLLSDNTYLSVQFDGNLILYSEVIVISGTCQSVRDDEIGYHEYYPGSVKTYEDGVKEQWIVGNHQTSGVSPLSIVFTLAFLVLILF